jgi:protein-disulfide isomerase
MVRRQRRLSTTQRDPEPLYPKVMEMPDLIVPVSDRDHIQGPETAEVTLVEYGDYECPYCAEAYPMVKEIQRQMAPKLRFVFRHFPLTQIHPQARHAAKGAEAAGGPEQVLGNARDVVRAPGRARR